MRTLLAALAAAGLLAGAAAAQGWEKAADLGLALTQSGYSDSWQGNESGSITWAFTGNLSAARQVRPSLHWANTLKLLYGETHKQVVTASGERGWQAPEKSADRIFLESLAKLTLGGYVDPFAAFTAETPFYTELVAPAGAGDPLGIERRWLVPLTLTESAGIGRTAIDTPTQNLFSRLGLALRHNRVPAAVLAGGGPAWEVESETTTYGGLEWVTDHWITFSQERTKLTSKLRVFQALFNSKEDDLKGLPGADDWKTADLALETTLSSALAKYLQMTFFVEFLYSKQVVDEGRFRETLGLGLSYKLF